MTIASPASNRSRHKFKMPDLESLKLRHATACDLKQTVDRDKITVAMREWLVQISAPAAD